MEPVAALEFVIQLPAEKANHLLQRIRPGVEDVRPAQEFFRVPTSIREACPRRRWPTHNLSATFAAPPAASCVLTWSTPGGRSRNTVCDSAFTRPAPTPGGRTTGAVQGKRLPAARMTGGVSPRPPPGRAARAAPGAQAIRGFPMPGAPPARPRIAPPPNSARVCAAAHTVRRQAEATLDVGDSCLVPFPRDQPCGLHREIRSTPEWIGEEGHRIPGQAFDLLGRDDFLQLLARGQRGQPRMGDRVCADFDQRRSAELAQLPGAQHRVCDGCIRRRPGPIASAGTVPPR